MRFVKFHPLDYYCIPLPISPAILIENPQHFHPMCIYHKGMFTFKIRIKIATFAADFKCEYTLKVPNANARKNSENNYRKYFVNNN